MLYNNPATCGGLSIGVETCARLAEIRNIRGIKDSSGDLQNTIELIRNVPDSFSVLMGRDTLIFHALISGARGAVPATANLAPRLTVEIYEAFQRGDLAAAQAAQQRLSPVRLSLGLGTQPAGVKAGLALLGMSIGPCRAPVGPLSPASQQQMRAILQEAGLLRSAPK
jgi:4-hydroxy-tetrahydrodipicolinate synthase